MEFESLTAGDLNAIEAIYEKYLENPQNVDPSWKSIFQNLSDLVDSKEIPKSDVKDAFRKYGHLIAQTNPIAVSQPERPPVISEENPEMEKIYCGNIGYEYMHLSNTKLRNWIQEEVEKKDFDLSTDQKKRILEQLNNSELFESFLQTKFTGQKRFSLEGAETLIPMLDAILNIAVEHNLEEVVLGMAHRGRLNVLSNILHKTHQAIFSEFEGQIPESFEGSGDVKYHKGYYCEKQMIKGHQIKINLTPNPSHLESVDPVVEGQTRAKQVQIEKNSYQKVMPILIHGDAAFSGQGVVYETLQLAKLPGYETGGTIHIIINNQIGFTTLPAEYRSTTYCTDIGKAFDIPVFHVNAEDPEGCIFASLLAFKIRDQFQQDVFIDLNCYRKYGHNETDEPFFTQPIEYRLIRKKQSIREIYRDQLIQGGLIQKEIAEKLEEDFKKSLQEALSQKPQLHPEPNGENKKNGKDFFAPFETGVKKEILRELTELFTNVPEDFNIHPKLKSHLKDQKEMAEEKKPLDWGMAESLAYAALLWEGVHIRLTGQDSCRGTFSHRHAVWMDQQKESAFYPLQHLSSSQGKFEIYNSPLSEMGALGFEYGYTLGYPEALVIWEAQFGDFSNGAQVMIDQYIATGEQKWNQQSGITLYLPHGYEGQGPEHSSARIERFLTLAGRDNMLIVYPTLPAQMFHLLRRQVLKPMMKPLIVFTPKGLLRYPACVSHLSDLEKGQFQEILEDPAQPKEPRNLIFCSGRIYFDLVEQQNREEFAIIRIEQLYPLYTKKLKEIIEKYTKVQRYMWVQEEPENMGAWDYIRPILQKLVPKELEYIGRQREAAPATGLHQRHEQEHEAIMKKIFMEKSDGQNRN